MKDFNIMVKYCGGCNSLYDRKEMTKRIEKELSLKTIPYDSNSMPDLLLIIKGCRSECINFDEYQSKYGTFIIQDENEILHTIGKIRKTMESLTTDDKNISCEIKEGIAFITINRPKKLNALNFETLIELDELITYLEDHEEAKVLVLTGAGRAFVAGADISEMRNLKSQEGRNRTIFGQKLFNKIENMDKPVIAAINGYALGGGCELAMACDIRIASNKAKFGQPEVNLGIIPGYGGTQRLPRLIGKGKAKYLIFTGDIVDVDEAYRMGLVDKIVSEDELMNTATYIAKLIMEKAPIAIKMAKRAINNGIQVDLNTGIAYESEAYTVAFNTKDRVEGMTAFLEKRKPHFKNE